MTTDIFNKLSAVCPAAKKDEPMSRHTTFKIGGPADCFLEPSGREELLGLIEVLKAERVPYIILGNGSNMLISDRGVEGAVINIAGGFSGIEISGGRIRAGAGVLLSVLSKAALSEGLSGLEFASGIPGSLGGAVYMNAGAYEHEMKEIIKSAECIDSDGNIKSIPAEKLEFGYRKSYFSGRDCVILSCLMELKKGNKDEIAAKMSELNKRRADKQPLNMPSAGSVFKRPRGHFAGTLIEQAGLKGYRIGNAMVSEKHAGFIVNTGGATAADVCALIEHIIKTVEEKFSVRLEPEIKLIGR